MSRGTFLWGYPAKLVLTTEYGELEIPNFLKLDAYGSVVNVDFDYVLTQLEKLELRARKPKYEPGPVPGAMF